MTCQHTASGCNAPESQCAGLCTKPKLRFFPKPIPMPIEYAEPEPEPHVDSAGDEPLGMVQAAAGYVALLLLTVALVAFAVGYFA